MKKKRAITAVISIIYVVFLLLCSYSGPVKDGPVYAPLHGPREIIFSSGSFPEDSTELNLVIQPQELELLDYFKDLKSVDFSGSTCYEQLHAWEKAHPDVAVTYSFSFPTGATADNHTEALDLSGINSSNLADTISILKYAPNLKSINLGEATPEASLSAEEVASIQAAAPNAKLDYKIQLLGDFVSLDVETLDLSTLAVENVDEVSAALKCLSNLKNVTLGSEETNDLSIDNIVQLENAAPNAVFDYSFSLYEQALNTSDETVSFSHIPMTDRGAAVRKILPMMKSCKYLDMDSCEVSNEDMASIRADFPDIKVVWRIWFGSHYSVRTDVERILASKPSKGGTLNDKEVEVLKYCTDVKYMDLGHNEAITNLSFVNSMPNLEVFICAMNPISDISYLANCPKLEYLELNTTKVADLSPLSGLKELRHLNIANCENVSDISPLYGLTELERLWIGSIDPVPPEQVEKMQQCAPNCDINTVTVDPTGGKWRLQGYTELSLQRYEETGWLQEVLHPRYELLKKQFGYTDADFSFTWNDPLY